MKIRNTSSVYGAPAKFFHWVIFILIAGLLTVGFLMGDMQMGPDKFRVYGLHKSFGITVLILAALRLGWKTVNQSPLLPDSMRNIENFLAKSGHALLYVLMFAMPISGWAMSSAAGLPVSVFGWFTLPNFVDPDKPLSHTLRETHELIAYAIIAVVSLHILAALLHHFYYKDNVLRRMLPFIKVE